MISIPSRDTQEWQAAQINKNFGSITRSKNIDLNASGQLKLSRKPTVLFGYGALGSGPDAVDPAFQDNIQAILTDTTYAYILAAAGMFVMLLTDTLETAVGTSNNGSQPTFGFDSDMVWYQGRPHVSGGQYVSSLNTGISSWNSRVISGLDTTMPHPLCNRERAGTLLVGNGNTVQQYSSGYALDTANTLTIPEQYIVTSIRTNGQFVYVGTRNKYAGEARLFIWNGVGQANQLDYPCGADWIYSMTVYKSAITVVTSAGQIRRFSGGGFEDLASFPVYYTPFSWSISAPQKSLVGRVTSRGLEAGGDNLYVVIDGSFNNGAGVYPGTYLPEQPSGLWEFSTRNGLYHKAGINLMSRLRMSPTELNSNYLKFASPHGAQTGDAVMASPNTLTGLNAGQVYYALVDSGAGTNTLRLSLSPSDALRGQYVAIGGVVGIDAFVFDQSSQVSATSITYPGAVFPLGATKPSLFYGSEVLYGGSIYNSTNGINEATIMSLGMGRNIGTFTLPKISSTQIKDTFQKIVSFYENIHLSTDSIRIKYRNYRKQGLPTPLFFSGSATMTSATTFTVNTLLKDFKSVSVGDEIEFVRGVNAGYHSHITAIDSTNPTYVVTIDESLPNTSGSFDFIADNWKKIRTITTAGKDFSFDLDEATLDTSASKWIEIKVELRGTDVIINEMQLINATQTKSA